MSSTPLERPVLIRRPALLWRGLGAAAIVIALDQLSKWLIVTMLPAQPMQPPPRYVLVPGVLDLINTTNPGVSFSMLHGVPSWALALGALAIIAVLLAWLARNDRFWPALGLGLIIGGAIGNVIDRVRLGEVIDFIDLHWWPVFNVADSAISIGVVLLVLDGLFARGEGSKMASAEARPSGEKPDSRSS
jgi:signal peptidase II